MKNVNKKNLIISTIICILPLLVGIFFGDKIPELIPVKLAKDGTVLSSVDKTWIFYRLPAICVLMNIFAIYTLTKEIDNEEDVTKQGSMKAAYFICPVIALAVSGFALINVYTGGVDFAVILSSLGGFLMILYSLFVWKAEQGHGFSLNLPWMIASDKAWKITHILFGITFMAGGIGVIYFGLIKNYYLVAACIVGAIVIPVLFSIFYFNMGKKGF